MAELTKRLEKTEKIARHAATNTQRMAFRVDRMSLLLADGSAWDRGTVLHIPKPPPLYYDIYPRRRPLYGSTSYRVGRIQLAHRDHA